jgi:hypothetical protein
MILEKCCPSYIKSSFRLTEAPATGLPVTSSVTIPVITTRSLFLHENEISKKKPIKNNLKIIA